MSGWSTEADADASAGLLPSGPLPGAGGPAAAPGVSRPARSSRGGGRDGATRCRLEPRGQPVVRVGLPDDAGDRAGKPRARSGSTPLAGRSSPVSMRLSGPPSSRCQPSALSLAAGGRSHEAVSGCPWGDPPHCGCMADQTEIVIHPVSPQGGRKVTVHALRREGGPRQGVHARGCVGVPEAGRAGGPVQPVVLGAGHHPRPSAALVLARRDRLVCPASTATEPGRHHVLHDEQSSPAPCPDTEVRRWPASPFALSADRLSGRRPPHRRRDGRTP